MINNLERGRIVIYKHQQWSVVKVHDDRHVEIWRNSARAVVPMKELKIVG